MALHTFDIVVKNRKSGKISSLQLGGYSKKDIEQTVNAAGFDLLVIED